MDLGWSGISCILEMEKKYLVTVLVVEYLILVMASGNHHLLHVVVVGVFVLKLYITINVQKLIQCHNGCLLGSF